jgi:hypothetical protein
MDFINLILFYFIFQKKEKRPKIDETTFVYVSHLQVEILGYVYEIIRAQFVSEIMLVHGKFSLFILFI